MTTACLKPSAMAHAADDILIDRLIGPGLTVVGAEVPQYRYMIQEQMAEAVATGGRFLGLFDTYQSRVLLVAHGRADYEGARERLRRVAGPGKGWLPDIRSEWPRVGVGCFNQLGYYKQANPDFRLAFLGDFENVKSTINTWYAQLKEVLAEKEEGTDYFTKQQLIRGMDVENVDRLRNFAVENGVCIVIGQDLNTHGRLYSWQGLRYRDTEIHIVRQGDGYRLKVVPPSTVMQTGEWEVMMEGDKFINPEREVAMDRQEECDCDCVSLNDKEREIVDAMWNRGVMRPGEVARVTGLSRSTVYQRLRALESDAKGRWVVGLEDKAGRAYFVDTAKAREWQ
jgi:hypothetical protein